MATPTTQPAASPTGQSAGASASDILTTLKNLVTGLATLGQNYLSVEGAQNFAALTVPTVVKPSSGRVARVSVVAAGSATGFIYDGGNLSATTKPMYVIPTAVGVYDVRLPMSFGVLVVPGAGQTVSGSYS